MKTINNTKISKIIVLLIIMVLLSGCAFKGRQEEKKTYTGDPGSLQVHYIDVGQGDATLIICDGHSMLIDAGNNDKGTTVQLYLQKQGINSIDYVIGTHPDADHIGGMDVILYKFDVKKVMMPESGNDTETYKDVINVIRDKRIERKQPKVGETYKLGKAVFTVVCPQKEYDDSNNNSIGIILQNGSEHRFMFCGDAEYQSEQDMVASGMDLSADVYKVSHHGSNTATSQAFLDAVDPTYAIISCGEGNSYGHPHQEVLQRLQDNDVQIYRTDQAGTIVAMSDGKHISWTFGKDNSIPGEKETVQEGKENTTYILNTKTKKIHRINCDSVKDIADNNKQETKDSVEELIQQGYTRCKRCNP